MRTSPLAASAALVLASACGGSGPADVEEPAAAPDPVDTWCARWAPTVDALGAAGPDDAAPAIDATLAVARDGTGLDEVGPLAEVVTSTWPADDGWSDAVAELYRMCTSP